MTRSVRLYVDQPLAPGQPVVPSQDQAHYLFSVMRLGVGDFVLVFNGLDGEFRAAVVKADRRAGVLEAVERTAPLRLPPDLWLVFAPLKKARTDYIVEKAVELGAARILPVQTRLTSAERTRQDRLQAHAVEAAEQCGATFVPVVEELQPFQGLLDRWPMRRRLVWADETLAGLAAPLPPRDAMPAAIVIGPEGGFSGDERKCLRALPHVWPISLGPRILRADTAAVAALALWQQACGDWQRAVD
jgi:16S rRNA (uracil1498-N3)-methyltransferase